MGGDSKKKKKTKKKRVLAENTVGAAADKSDDDVSPPKKPRGAATGELTKEVTAAAQAFRKHADKHAPGWKPRKGDNTAELVVRVADIKGGLALISKPVVQALDLKNYRDKLNAARVRNALKTGLADVPVAAFVAAGAPPETEEEEEGYVAGEIDVKLAKGDDVWYRYRTTAYAGAGTPGVSRQQIEKALKPERLSDPKDTYAEERGFTVRRVTPELRCATATNKVVLGYHEPLIAHADRNWGCNRSHAAQAERDEEERKAKAADAVAAKEKEEAVRKARYDMFGLTYSSVPPLPDGATDADLERLMREDLAALYGH